MTPGVIICKSLMALNHTSWPSLAHTYARTGGKSSHFALSIRATHTCVAAQVFRHGRIPMTPSPCPASNTRTRQEEFTLPHPTHPTHRFCPRSSLVTVPRVAFTKRNSGSLCGSTSSPAARPVLLLLAPPLNRCGPAVPERCASATALSFSACVMLRQVWSAGLNAHVAAPPYLHTRRPDC